MTPDIPAAAIVLIFFAFAGFVVGALGMLFGV